MCQRTWPQLQRMTLYDLSNTPTPIVSECALLVFNAFLVFSVHCRCVVCILAHTCILSLIAIATSCGSTDLYITLELAIEYKAFAYLTVSNIHVVALSSIVSVSHVRNYRCNESNRHVPLTHADYPIQRLRCTHHLDHIRIPHYVLACSRGAI